MMPRIEIRHTLDAYAARLSLLPAERMQAAVRTLNRTMTTVRAEGARALQKEYPGLKVGTIKKRMKFVRATRGKPQAEIVFSGARFSLFHNWRARQTKTGVRVGKLPYRLETWDGTPVPLEKLQQAFIQRPTSNRGRWNVYQRMGRERYPIQGVVAPGLARAFVERGIRASLSRLARQRFAIVFQQEAKFRLSKRAG